MGRELRGRQRGCARGFSHAHAHAHCQSRCDILPHPKILPIFPMDIEKRDNERVQKREKERRRKSLKDRKRIQKTLITTFNMVNHIPYGLGSRAQDNHENKHVHENKYRISPRVSWLLCCTKNNHICHHEKTSTPRGKQTVYHFGNSVKFRVFRGYSAAPACQGLGRGRSGGGRVGGSKSRGNGSKFSCNW